MELWLRLQLGQRWTPVNEYCKSVLNAMYVDCIQKLGVKNESSLLISMLSRNKNNVKRAFLSSARDQSPSQSSVMSTLKEEGYVKEVCPGQYIISASGILYVEFELFPLGIEHYVKWIDDVYLQLDNEPISDKNRVILLALFSVRCFSKETSATYSDNLREKAFIDLLYDCYEFLSSKQLVKPDCLDSSNSKSKSKISSILNQIDRLPSSTGMKFIASDKRYHIDVLCNGEIDRQSITYITRIILGDRYPFQQIDEFEHFCNAQYMKYGYIFTNSEQSFDDPFSQFQIKNGIEDITD